MEEVYDLILFHATQGAVFERPCAYQGLAAAVSLAVLIKQTALIFE